MIRRVLQIVAGVIAAWIALLLVLGFTHAGRTADGVAARLGESLQGTATYGDASLALVRGGLVLERLAVRRDGATGKLSLEVGELRCDLPPLGLALVDRECGELAIGGMRLEVSALALLRLQRVKRPPTRAGRVVIRDAVLVLAPSAFLPDLGRVRVKIDRAIAGPTQFRTPLSWIFALEELRASLDLPAGLSVHLAYRGGVMSASGSVFGSAPVEIPVTLPVREATDDARAELDRLVRFGKDLTERLVARRAKEWIRSKLPGE